MNRLLPRLGFDAAEKEMRTFLAGLDEDPGKAFKWHMPEGARFAATGGSAIDDYLLDDLRAGLMDVASRAGFGAQGATPDHGTFDRSVAVFLTESEMFGTGEALDDEIWSFIGTALAPDLVHWRFGRTPARYLGGVRNTFQRLWIRGSVLDRGQGTFDRWQLLDCLTEDGAVQLFERSSIAGDNTLARAIAEAWHRSSIRHGRDRMQGIMRKAMILIRMGNVIQMLSMLSSQALASHLDGVFEKAAR
jgi:hypothetical protein